MSEWWNTVLKCPTCGAALAGEGQSLFCKGAKRHCFDLAAAGYVNLAPSKAAGGGDDAALIAARVGFLESDAYLPIAKRAVELLGQYAPGGTVLDAGCGEGYYTCKIAEAGHPVLGLDLSKNGIKHAAKVAKRKQLSAFFAVGGIFDLPVADGSLDAVVSLFAPVAEAEFLRVLKPGGILLLIGAGRQHLLDLKRVLYDTPYENEARADLPTAMALLHEEELAFSMELPQALLQQLFAMTPYFYRTPQSGRDKLAAEAALTVGAQAQIYVYQKP